MDRRPPRGRDTLSPSARKNLELFQLAGEGKSFNPNFIGSIKYHGGSCGNCVNWPKCLPELGPGQAKMDYCARTSRGYKMNPNLWPWARKEQNANANV